MSEYAYSVCGNAMSVCENALSVCGNALPGCGNALSVCGNALFVCGNALSVGRNACRRKFCLSVRAFLGETLSLRVRMLRMPCMSLCVRGGGMLFV